MLPLPSSSNASSLVADRLLGSSATIRAAVPSPPRTDRDAGARAGPSLSACRSDGLRRPATPCAARRGIAPTSRSWAPTLRHQPGDRRGQPVPAGARGSFAAIAPGPLHFAQQPCSAIARRHAREVHAREVSMPVRLPNLRSELSSSAQSDKKRTGAAVEHQCAIGLALVGDVTQDRWPAIDTSSSYAVHRFSLVHPIPSAVQGAVPTNWQWRSALDRAMYGRRPKRLSAIACQRRIGCPPIYATLS